jgi:hypothetical protein
VRVARSADSEHEREDGEVLPDVLPEQPVAHRAANLLRV